MTGFGERFVPHREFPAHAFVPGRTARHQARTDGASRELGRALPPERWREDEDYLFGVDLYHAGFLWEAHEAWERPWLASNDERQRRLLQALIQLAAACLRLEMNEPSSSASPQHSAPAIESAAAFDSKPAVGSARTSGATQLARAASEKLRALGEPEFMGLAPAELASAVDRFFARAPVNASGRPPLVLRTSAQPPGGSLA
ncbi:MAG: DUF309 domain-containing protein [Planctomycetes bacterium]|nr:DUF309 domain-containing protein [Planctomycetota bacterium]